MADTLPLREGVPRKYQERIEVHEGKHVVNLMEGEMAVFELPADADVEDHDAGLGDNELIVVSCIDSKKNARSHRLSAKLDTAVTLICKCCR